MALREISIRVSDQAANAYEAATPQQRRKLDALLTLRLTEAAGSSRTLEDIMDDMAAQARARGLTPEHSRCVTGPIHGHRRCAIRQRGNGVHRAGLERSDGLVHATSARPRFTSTVRTRKTNRPPKPEVKPQMRWILLSLLLFAHAALGDPMDGLRWTARPLVLFAQGPENADVLDLKGRLVQSRAELDDRRMVLIEVYPEGALIDGEPLDAADAERLRARFSPDAETATLILVGLDGGEKRRTTPDVDLTEVFAVIDAMPMRRRELDDRLRGPSLD